ncbi:MAG: hypothetical protein ACOX0X_01760 [Candidatus Dojkabacteria bacterium]
MKKKTLKKEFSDIFAIISGELSLREREEKIQELKREAIKRKKAEKRRKIVERDVVLEEGDIPTKKVVQNIKLFEWEALDRYSFKFEQKTFRIIIVVSMAFVLFLAILENYFLMACVIALLFFIYVAGTNKPSKVKYKITARGIDVGDRLYEWFMLNNFWFSKRDSQYFLIVETRLRYPKGLIFLLEREDKDPIFLLLQEKLLYKDVRKQGRFDKLMYGEYIPFDSPDL